MSEPDSQHDALLDELLRRLPPSRDTIDAFLAVPAPHAMSERSKEALIASLREKQRQQAADALVLQEPRRAPSLGAFLRTVREKEGSGLEHIARLCDLPADLAARLEANTVLITEAPVQAVSRLCRWLHLSTADALELVTKSHTLYQLPAAAMDASARYDARRGSETAKQRSLAHAAQELAMRSRRQPVDNALAAYLRALERLLTEPP